jgi:hypothetical protein
MIPWQTFQANPYHSHFDENEIYVIFSFSAMAAARSLSFVLVDGNPDTNFHQSQNRPFDLTRSFIFGGTIL